MTSRYILLAILAVDAFILLFQTSELSISYPEAQLLYGDPSFLQFLVKFFLSVFGNNDFGLRFVMIVFQLLSAVLIYEISKEYIQAKRNRLWLVVIFLLLPGVVSSAIIVNSAGLLLFGLLLFIYLENRVTQQYINIILLIYALIDVSFSYLFIALSIYYISQKKMKHFFYMIVLYMLSSYLYGFEIKGVPTGHFLDTIGVYSTIFTPIIFIYIFYTLYRRFLMKKIDIIWYISTVVLLLSLILSFRQRLPLEHMAPYVILSLPLAAASFIEAYRVRLKIYRTKYRVAFILSFIFLILNTLIVFFNKELYRVIEKPSKHFAYDMQVAKELSQKLHSKNLECVDTDKKMQLRLKFYGITQCAANKLSRVNGNSINNPDVTIRYKDRVVYTANVTKINNQ